MRQDDRKQSRARQNDAELTEEVLPSAIPLYDVFPALTQPQVASLIHAEPIAAKSNFHNWRVEPHRHPYFDQWFLWLKGSAELRLENDTLHLVSPAMMFLPAGCVHSFKASEQADVIIVSVSHDITVSESKSAGLPFGHVFDHAAVLALSEDAAERNTSYFRGLLREYDSASPFQVQALAAHLRLILIEMLRLKAEMGNIASTEDSQLLNRLNQLIDAHFTVSHPVSAYAAWLGVSESVLSRSCKRIAGRSVLQLVLDRRLVEAKRQLRYGAATVSQIAYAVGFQEAPYFSRFFMQRTGMRPSTWRVQSRAGDASVP